MPPLLQLQSPGKLVALVVVIVGCFVYVTVAVVNGVDGSPAWAVLTLVVGYLVGNGAGALKGNDQQPVFKPTDDPPLSPRAATGA